MAKIAEFHSYEGQALSLITSEGKFTGLARIKDISGRAWAVNHDRVMYVKHSTANRSPWVFTFAPEHQTAVRDLFNKYRDKTYVVFVCSHDGICAVPYGDYSATIEENFGVQRWLKVSKPNGGGFRLEGSEKKLRGVVPVGSFPGALFS
jgi:hypothetical protein